MAAQYKLIKPDGSNRADVIAMVGDLVQEYGNATAVAKELGVTDATVSRYLRAGGWAYRGSIGWAQIQLEDILREVPNADNAKEVAQHFNVATEYVESVLFQHIKALSC